ncbi:MAG: ABC transporter ATP-binding protein [Desulfobacteraceae bacterium]|jgi:branched-chain amino acid transport system ATP-binding protein
MLDVNNIEVVYNDVMAVLRGISFKVLEGDMVCLLGNNGAGKTTTLKAISAILKSQKGTITKGTIHFNDKRIDNLFAAEIVDLGLIQVPEGRRIFIDLTVYENLRAGAFLEKDRKKLRANHDMVKKYFPILGKRDKQIAGYLSGGEQQMLAIGRALMTNPKCIMLDEPSLGLAPLLVNRIFEIINKINKTEGTSFLIVEQNASIALSSTSYGYIMENGKIVLDGESDKLSENEDVREFYLGLKEDSTLQSFAEVKHYKRRKRWLG